MSMSHVVICSGRRCRIGNYILFSILELVTWTSLALCLAKPLKYFRCSLKPTDFLFSDILQMWSLCREDTTVCISLSQRQWLWGYTMRDIKNPSLWSPQAFSLFSLSQWFSNFHIHHDHLRSYKYQSAQAPSRPTEADSELTWWEIPPPLSMEMDTLKTCGLESLSKVKKGPDHC